jgi:hypothetical protein
MASRLGRQTRRSSGLLCCLIIAGSACAESSARRSDTEKNSGSEVIDRVLAPGEPIDGVLKSGDVHHLSIALQGEWR